MIAKRWFPSALWAAFILLLTSIPVADTLTSSALGGADKVVHLGLYAVLGYLVATALQRGDSPWRSAAVAVLTIAVFAAADELHQIFVPGRIASVTDWIADVVGACAGAAAAALRVTRRQLQA